MCSKVVDLVYVLGVLYMKETGALTCRHILALADVSSC
jgi:hypothetical protein